MARRRSDPRQAAGLISEILDQVGLVWRLLLDRRVPMPMKLVVPAAVLYVLSPIDVLPDFFVGLGQLDDLALILIAFKVFVDLAPKQVVQEHLERLRGRGDRTAGGQKASIIDGQYRVVDEQGHRP